MQYAGDGKTSLDKADGEKMDKGGPLVSVVMSVYNGGGLLAGAVASILDQTFKDFKFIIVNDASADDIFIKKI